MFEYVPQSHSYLVQRPCTKFRKRTKEDTTMRNSMAGELFSLPSCFSGRGICTCFCVVINLSVYKCTNAVWCGKSGDGES